MADKPYAEIQVSSWDWFDERLEGLKPGEWLFRGQSDACWSLKTTFYRSLADIQMLVRKAEGNYHPIEKTYEDLILGAFQKNASQYLESLPFPDEKLEWLAIMQHYGAPTRLLDVTLSPHIATYFALEAGSKECCVFAFNRTILREFNQPELGGKTNVEIQNDIFEGNEYYISTFEPRSSNERLVSQQGLFLVPSQVDIPFENLFIYYWDIADDYACIKYIIPPELRLLGLKRLSKMNISSRTLFPGLEGFCKSLKFQAFESIQKPK